MKNENRSGSALVVVLGMLAVLIMMAVAFSVFVRTERKGTTNLRHSIVAKLTLQTAISQVMESIDRSFEDQENNWPVPAWPAGFLTSNTNAPFYQSEAMLKKSSDLTSGDFRAARAANARILNSEMRKHISPAQAALVNNAKIGWAPIRAGVSASATTSSGRPVEDVVKGRYAFVALNTTGLLDMNHFYPYDPANPSNPGKGMIPKSINPISVENSDFANQYLVGKDFFDLRERTAGDVFTSYADMMRMLGSDPNPTSDRYYKYTKDQVVTRDLFGTHSMSVEECAPDGAMKVPLMNPAASGNKAAYIRLIHDAFKKVFKESGDEYTFWKNNSGKLPELTRAQLATIALLDYMDDDYISSGKDVAAALIGPDAIINGTANPLDYPCTEPIPQFTGFYAHFDFPGKDGANYKPTGSGTDSTSGLEYKEWNVGFQMYTTVASLGPSGIDERFTAEIGIDFSMMADGINDLFGGNWQRVAPGNDFQPMAGIRQVKFAAPLDNALFNSNYEPHLESKTGNNMTLFGLELDKIMTVREYYNPTTAGAPRMTDWEVSKSNQSLLSEIRIRAKIKDGPQTILQIPAQALERPDNRHLVRISPGLYNSKRSSPAWGWAMVTDPRFGYNTVNIENGNFPGNSYGVWLNNELAEAIVGHGGLDPELVNICTSLMSIEEADTDATAAIVYQGQGNYFIDLWLTSDQNKARGRTDAISGGAGIYPDTLLSYKNGGAPYSVSGDNFMMSLFTRVANEPMESAGELGRLMIGPWETFSLFANFRPNGKLVHHRVLDYFAPMKIGNPRNVTTPPRAGEEYFPPVYNGKLNLNAQRDVLCVHKDSSLGVSITNGPPYNFNSDPLAVVMTGLVLNEEENDKDTTRGRLSGASATAIAESFYQKTEFERKWNSTDFGRKDDESLEGMPMISRISDLGNSSSTNTPGGGGSPMVEALMNQTEKTIVLCDAHREALISGTVDKVTTRGQTFTVLIRADAYSTSYGSDNASGGSSLSSVRAIVELWRDPQPIRDSTGAIFPLGTDTPTHTWHVRSVHLF